jgi:Putative prokaryotic signal transducing protein
MDFTLFQSFDNYIDAHIVKGRLEDQGIHCWLKDENLSALIVDPILTNAVSGGIKLMVPKEELQSAIEILNQPSQPFREE